MHVDNEVIRLKLLKNNWNNEHVIMERQISQHYPREIQACEQRIARLQADVEWAEKTRSNEFSIELEGEIYNEKSEAGELLLQLVISDPKAELFHYSSVLLEKLGYEVFALDFRHPEKSHHYNLLQPIIDATLAGDQEQAEMLAWDSHP
jgi:hypothetical protein